MISSLLEFAAVLEPSEQRDDAPIEWSVHDSLVSASCEVQHVASPEPATANAMHWVYRFQSSKLPKGTSALARISVLLRGPEKTGLRKYVHSVTLGFRDKNEKGERALLVDIAENPDAAEDERVLEFPRFPAERPLMFGSSVELFDVHVHFVEPPPETLGRDMVKVVADAVYAPRAEGQTICMQLDRPDGLSEKLTALAEAILVRDGDSSALRMEAMREELLASAVYEQARLYPLTASWGAMTVSLSNPVTTCTAGRAWSAPPADERPYWAQQLDELADILPTKYAMT